MRRLVATLTLLSKKLQCYKITLECAQKNVEFYKKLGYAPSEETYMQCRFFDWVLQGCRQTRGSGYPNSQRLFLHRFPQKRGLTLAWWRIADCESRKHEVPVASPLGRSLCSFSFMLEAILKTKVLKYFLKEKKKTEVYTFLFYMVIYILRIIIIIIMNSTKSSPVENEERLCKLLHRLV